MTAAAELAAFDGTDLEAIVDFSALAERITRTTGDPWWPGPEVRVHRSRRDARSSTATCGGGPAVGAMVVDIRLAAPQMTVATAAHELAHALAGVEARHGPRFRQALLDVVIVMTNLDTTDRRHRTHVDQLADAFAAHGLVVGPRRWAPPPASTSGAIVL